MMLTLLAIVKDADFYMGYDYSGRIVDTQDVQIQGMKHRRKDHMRLVLGQIIRNLDALLEQTKSINPTEWEEEAEGVQGQLATISKQLDQAIQNCGSGLRASPHRAEMRLKLEGLQSMVHDADKMTKEMNEYNYAIKKPAFTALLSEIRKQTFEVMENRSGWDRSFSTSSSLGSNSSTE